MSDFGYAQIGNAAFATIAGPAVLVCEDREDVNGTVTDFFESYDLPSVSAFDIEEAEHLLRTHSSTIRLALVDMSLHLNARGGYNFVLQCADTYPSIRFILMTAHDLSDADHGRLQEHRIGFFRKPFDLHEIVRMLGMKDGVPDSEDSLGAGSLDYENPSKDEIFSAVVTLQTRERYLVRRWRRHAEGLVKQILATSGPSDGPIFVNGRKYSTSELIQEVNGCTPLGERLVELHYRLVDRLLEGKEK